MNDRLEDDLRAALRREDPGAEFAGRVLNRTRHSQPARRTSWNWRWAAASLAACLTLAIGLGEYRERVQERQRGEAVKEELMQAMRLTGSKLRMAQEKVRHWNE